MAKSEKWLAAMAARRGKGTNQYTKAKDLGLPKPSLSKETRAKLAAAGANKSLSKEQRDRLSKIRIDFLKENPDKVPYRLNHYSNGRSYPEIYWKEILDNNDIKYEEQYQISYYQLDFAILDSKIDLEIDGDQHYLDPKIVKSDIRRTRFLEGLGWTIVRIRWSEYQKLTNKEDFVKNIIKQLNADV